MFLANKLYSHQVNKPFRSFVQFLHKYARVALELVPLLVVQLNVELRPPVEIE